MNENLKPITTLRPFTRFCMTIGVLPSSYLMSMTYEEQLIWLCNYLEKTVIPALNNNGLAVEELQAKYIELKSYIDNYFDNLDIQEEINNKLDEMAESGELTDIIAQYLNLAGVLVYDTISDLSGASNVVNGSSCYCLGATSYNDGYGSYYKIRNITSGDVVDGFNIVAITDNNSIIAERLQNSYINTINNEITDIKTEINIVDNIMLQNYLTYDFSNTDYTQGSTNDSEGNIYVYKTSNNTTGDLLRFKTNALQETLSSINFAHGNNILAKNGKIYSTYTDKKIKVYDLSTQNYSEINIFSDLIDYSELWGLCNYDENHILVALGYSSGGYINNIDNCAIAKINLTNLTYELLNLTNTNFYNIDNLAVQCICYLNNHLYFMVSQPNMILDFIMSNDNYNLNKIYNIPSKDLFGFNVGEVEQLSPYVSTPNTLLLTTHVDEGPTSSYRTLKMYFLSFDTELSPYFIRKTINDKEHYRDAIYCDANATNLYENGSEDYPFRRILRALSFVNYNQLHNANQIVIKPGNYYIGTVYNLIKGAINPTASNDKIYFTGDTKFINCNNVVFNSSNNKMQFGKLSFDTSDVKIIGQVTTTNLIELDYSNVTIEDLISTFNETDVIPVRVRGGSRGIINVSSSSTGTYLFYLNTGGILFTNRDSVYRGDTASTYILSGRHSAD